MVKIFIMKSGTYFIGNKPDADTDLSGTGGVSINPNEGEMVKDVMEIMFVQKTAKSSQTGQEEVVMAPDLFPVGYPLNMKAKDISLKAIEEQSWFPMDSDIPLTFVKFYLDKVAECNSPIIQPKQGGIKY
jgi:hypothetical protein